MMRRGFDPGRIASVSFSVLGAAWFVFSLSQVVLSASQITVDSGFPGSGWTRPFHTLGISLPWVAFVTAMLMDEANPVASRRLAVVCLFASTALAIGAAVHHLWLDPKLGIALMSFHGSTIGKAVLGLHRHVFLLTVHGPLLGLAVWYWLRAHERLPARMNPRPAGKLLG